jgi:hypothetical protein
MASQDDAFQSQIGEAGFRAVPPTDVDRPLVTIDGVDADDEALAQLLEDTAKFIRAAKGRAGAEAFTQKTLSFQRIELNDTVSLKHRS